MEVKPRPFLLIVLDGWGHREASEHNAIMAAKTPTWDRLWQQYPHLLISGSGTGVGLPEGQMGNSEVGHLNLGAGRIVYQEFTRIEKAIAEEYFFDNVAMCHAIQQANANAKAIHIFGLLSPGGVHSHENQIHALIKLCAQQHAKTVYVHAFLDGRDTPPQSAKASLQALQQVIQDYDTGTIASLIGRFYVMDRDQRWQRTQSAYDLLTRGTTEYHAETAIAGLELAYARGETDEFVQATAIHDANSTPITINDGDSVIFMNYRADRARQITRAFTDAHFNDFERKATPKLNDFVSLTEYAKGLNVSVAYPPKRQKNVLGEYIADLGLKQLRIAETEKYAHVTFFFNGGIETPFNGEERILIPSPKVTTYDLKPEMSAHELTDQLVTAIDSNSYDLIICNFANPDMLGHTGNFNATVKAIETIDHCLERIIKGLQSVGGEAIITADHGNAEVMFDTTTNQPHTAHTHNLVPLLYIGREVTATQDYGALSDIAPTILRLLNLPIPPEMTGKPLFSE